MISVIFLTRKCPRQCGYCGIRDSNLINPELSVGQWIKAFQILENLGSTFNLVLGNEPWLYGEGLLDIINSTSVPTGVYTTCHPTLFNKFRNKFFQEGLNNLSAGLDYPVDFLTKIYPYDTKNHIIQKSYDALNGFLWTRLHYPNVTCHATITVTAKNFCFLPDIVKDMNDIGVHTNINFLHWNKDGKYDFFSKKEEMKDLMFTEEQLNELREVLEKTKKIDGIQNRAMLDMEVEDLVYMGWNCRGNPYGGPTVDADGSLRVCGYRQGSRTPQMSIFDLSEFDIFSSKPDKEYFGWEEKVRLDAEECPGCSWSCPLMYHYGLGAGQVDEIFLNHEGG